MLNNYLYNSVCRYVHVNMFPSLKVRIGHYLNISVGHLNGEDGESSHYVQCSAGHQLFLPPVVTLYQCSELATGCSSCLAQRKGTDFQCGWCGGSSTCIDASDSCSSSIANVSGNCPLPSITAISPTSGPTAGGTTVTVTGTDLGTAFEDIVSIRVGSLTCTPSEDSYVIGTSVSCDTDGGSGGQTQDRVDVVVRVRRMGGPDQNVTSVQQFRFGVPRVYSVSPTFGPAGGGTVVRVRGEDLDIGNQDRIRVTLMMTTGGTGRRRRRQTMGTATCTIM